MASRYPILETLDYCFSPITVRRNGDEFIVPCGKCDGCLLHQANIWSMRVGMEIESVPYTIFVTYTYNNKFLPTLKLEKSNNSWFWTSQHPDNIRFAGVDPDGNSIIKNREDQFTFQTCNPSQVVPAPQGMRDGFISYSSKRDFQLYLKLLRKDLDLYFKTYDKDRSIRYFSISEYGPTTYRCHIHTLFFLQSHEVAEYLLQSSLYKNWQMCDKVLFDKYTRYADSGTRNYVTNYVTGFSKLPALLKDKQIRPFRLSSKGSAIGFNSFDKEKVFNSLLGGDLSYVKRIERLGEEFILRYPKNFLSSLFPKCYHYGKRDFSRLLEVYGSLYWSVFGYGRRRLYSRAEERVTAFNAASHRFRACMHSSDYLATRKCYEFCVSESKEPLYYVSLLVQFYYKLDMYNLKSWYEWQEKTFDLDRIKVLSSYNNVGVLFAKSYSNHDNTHLLSAMISFFDGYGIDYFSLDLSNIRDIFKPDEYRQEYMTEVEEIIKDCVKVPKFNEQFGTAPHII